MKLSRTLKPMGLYRPAKWTADHIQRLGESLKHAVYKRICRHDLRKKTTLRESPSVLVIMSAGGIGNIIEATPLVQAIRTLWPCCRLTILCPYEDIFTDWCLIDELIPDQSMLEDRSFDYTFMPFWGWHGFPKEITANFERGRLFTTRILFQKWFLAAERNYNVDLARLVGYRGPTPPSYVNLTPPRVASQLNRPYICILPGGKPEKKWQFKRWPWYAELIGLICNRWPDFNVYVLGTSADHIDSSVFEHDRVTDLRDALSLSESAWVLKHSTAVVGNDCGPMHIAYAVNARTFAIFGPTCIVKNSAPGKNIIISSDQPCQPCQYSNLEECTTGDCIRNIKADEVLARIDKSLS